MYLSLYGLPLRARWVGAGGASLGDLHPQLYYTEHLALSNGRGRKGDDAQVFLVGCLHPWHFAAFLSPITVSYKGDPPVDLNHWTTPKNHR
jgi:hypothetical protein